MCKYIYIYIHIYELCMYSIIYTYILWLVTQILSKYASKMATLIWQNQATSVQLLAIGPTPNGCIPIYSHHLHGQPSCLHESQQDMYTYIHICICIHTYIHTYIHTHTHMYIYITYIYIYRIRYTMRERYIYIYKTNSLSLGGVVLSVVPIFVETRDIS